MTKELMTILTENQGLYHSDIIYQYAILDYCFHSFLIPLKGHNVTEVAHDCVVALKNWFQGRGIRNSFDTWHGRFISQEDNLSLTLQVFCIS